MFKRSPVEIILKGKCQKVKRFWFASHNSILIQWFMAKSCLCLSKLPKLLSYFRRLELSGVLFSGCASLLHGEKTSRQAFSKNVILMSLNMSCFPSRKKIVFSSFGLGGAFSWTLVQGEGLRLDDVARGGAFRPADLDCCNSGMGLESQPRSRRVTDECGRRGSIPLTAGEGAGHGRVGWVWTGRGRRGARLCASVAPYDQALRNTRSRRFMG